MCQTECGFIKKLHQQNSSYYKFPVVDIKQLRLIMIQAFKSVHQEHLTWLPVSLIYDNLTQKVQVYQQRLQDRSTTQCSEADSL